MRMIKTSEAFGSTKALDVKESSLIQNWTYKVVVLPTIELVRYGQPNNIILDCLTFPYKMSKEATTKQVARHV